MSRCGPYHLERTIGWGRKATFFSARIDGDSAAAQFVIRRARLSGRSFSQHCLRAAAEQQAAAAAGCTQLAPIHYFESDDDGFAYYATVHYEASLGQLLEAGCTLDSPSLREIVSGILDALTELHGKAHRPHGNLSAGNVLFDKDRNVILTDLAPTAKDTTAADDLIELGTIIYQFVRRQVRVGKLIPPLEYSPDWTACFGDDAVGWLVFTNGLLTRSGGETAGALKFAARELKSLSRLAAKVEKPTSTVDAGQPTIETHPLPPKPPSRLPKIAAALVLLAAIGFAGFFFWKKQHPVVPPEPPQKPPPGNITQFANELKQPLNPGDILNSDPAILRILKRIRDNLGEHGSEEDVRSILSNWDAPKAMETRAKEWRKPKREWTRLADELEAAAKLDLQGPRPIMEQLRDAASANKNSDALEKKWAEIATLLVRLNGSRAQVPMLPDFEKWAMREISQSLDAAAKSAEATKKTLDEIHEFVKADGGRIHQARFEKAAPVAMKEPSEERFRSWPADWLQQAKRYLRPPAADVNRWQAAATKADSSIQKIVADKKAVWNPKLQIFRDRILTALESEAGELDSLAAELAKVRSPNEEAQEQYVKILKSWKDGATAASDKDAAQASLDEFQKLTAGLPASYSANAGIAKAISAMNEAIATPDTISLQFSQPGWTLVPGTADANHAVYRFESGGSRVDIPFIALGRDKMAMAAVETPLILAQLSGSPPNPPGVGPQIRKSDFSPSQDWLWRQPATSIGEPNYLATDVKYGDRGSDACPVTWLTYAEADSMAKKLGGLLPTEEQWKSALGKEGPVKRLRASAWTAQFKQSTGWPSNAGKFQCFPNIGSFSTKAGLTPSSEGYMTDPGASPDGTNDKALWLTSVFPSGTRWNPNKDAMRFHHLIGNAAEWVTAENEPATSAAARIIGGSVVSSPKLPTREALKGYRDAAFDVTFRLAVPLYNGGAGDGLRKFLDAAKSIKPPAVAPPD